METDAWNWSWFSYVVSPLSRLTPTTTQPHHHPPPPWMSMPKSTNAQKWSFNYFAAQCPRRKLDETDPPRMEWVCWMRGKRQHRGPHWWDEWIQSDSERIRPFRTQGIAPLCSWLLRYSECVSSGPVTSHHGRWDEVECASLLPELQRVLSLVNEVLFTLFRLQRSRRWIISSFWCFWTPIGLGCTDSVHGSFTHGNKLTLAAFATKTSLLTINCSMLDDNTWMIVFVSPKSPSRNADATLYWQR